MPKGLKSPVADSEEIVRGDPALRKLALFGLAVLLLAGLWGVQRFHQALDVIKELVVQDPREARMRLRALTNVIMSVHILLATSCGVYFLSLGLRCLRAGRYPPRGMRVLKDTRIVRGSRVNLLSAVLILLGFLLFISNGFIWYFLSYLEKLGGTV